MKPFLHTEGLAVGYNGRPLLEEVCLAVRRGGDFDLIGPQRGRENRPFSKPSPVS